MDHKVQDMLSSMAQAATDIQRLTLNMALQQRVGRDWQRDIIVRAERIAQLAKGL